MRLARIILHGFKSFADRTEFDFDAPITGVVGPNGCGKSNVVDAIKWVLGERSAKTLRGKEMQDVIFAGSAGRAPAGMASVALVFDNPLLSERALKEIHDRAAELPREDDAGTTEDLDASDARSVIDRKHRRRSLPIDTETVEVERRLFRDGKSQYVINGRLARLRDIRELFLDTGVGADAYSIIEQGKVDAMLLANPVERRTFFEEAAGIARFKVRRTEAQRKLERTEVNLTRTREQLENTERRLRIVRGQAAKARTFLELDAEFKAHRLALAFDQYHDLRERLDGLTSRLVKLESERDAAVEAVEACENEKQDAELARHELDRERERLERERAAAQHERERAQQAAANHERSAAQAKVQLALDAGREQALAGRVEALAAQLVEGEREVEALAQESEALNRRVDALLAEREDAHKAASDARRAVGEQRAKAAAIDRERSALGAAIDADRSRLTRVNDQGDRLAAQCAALQDEYARVDAALGQSESEVGVLRARTSQVASALDDTVSSASTLSTDQRQRAEAVAVLTREQARLESRASTLSEMAERRVGLGDAVRHVLELRDAAREASARGEVASGVGAHIAGPVAELIQVSKEHVRAVEAALGTNLRAVVIDGRYDLGQSQDVAQLDGRVTFLPVELEAPTHSARTVEAPVGGAALIAHYIRGEDPYIGAIRKLLARTVLVSTLEEALRLSHGVLAGARFVTMAGELVEPDGRVVVGPMAGEEQGEGLLERATELKTLQVELDRVNAELLRERGALRAIDARCEALESELEAQREALSAAQHAAVKQEAERDRLRAEATRLARELPDLTAQRDEATQHQAELREAIASQDARRDELARAHDLCAAQLHEVEQQVEAAQVRVDGLGEQVSSARVELTAAGEKRSAAERELRRVRSEQEESGRQIEQLRSSVALGEAKVRDEEAAAQRATQEAQDALARDESIGAQLSEHAQTLQQAMDLVQRLGERLVRAREVAEHVHRDCSSVELSKRELEVRREGLEERTEEELHIGLAWEYDDYEAMMRDGDVSRIDVAETQHAIDTLRKEIKRLGNVNLDAMTEETQLEGRNEELAQQVADIDAARTMLEELITRLNDVSRDRFKEAFERIESHFSGKDGMFRRLFGGGQAHVKLIPNPETGEIDWLESGIEVTAKPPGKEPRSIAQLSGGEKTMTAVALLLSIFQSKPSPFCILDEVDAALDDANVERFCTIVRQFLDQCHFIVVTHNKRTMQIANRMYGVTMQERGVSKKVGVKFDQVQADGTFEATVEDGDGVQNGAARKRPAAQAEVKPNRAGKREAVAPVGANGASRGPSGGFAAARE
ncbi:MAG: chromosome segregation protein SMC [Phycisphaerales bacterium]|nr:chromosome segregation protein SMC [Phycisphaerales bacterium]